MLIAVQHSRVIPFSAKPSVSKLFLRMVDVPLHRIDFPGRRSARRDFPVESANLHDRALLLVPRNGQPLVTAAKATSPSLSSAGRYDESFQAIWRCVWGEGVAGGGVLGEDGGRARAGETSGGSITGLSPHLAVHEPRVFAFLSSPSIG